MLSDARAVTNAALVTDDVGWVTHVSNGVANVQGFSDLRANELIVFPGGLSGISASLSEHEVGVILLGPANRLLEGAEARRTKRVVDAPVGDTLLGRVIDPLGRPLDDRRPLQTDERIPIEQPAPPIMHRAPVETPLQTGIKAIDAAIPIGRGQRELIVGDRQSGKTSIAVDTILNQHDTGTSSPYTVRSASGRPRSRASSNFWKGATRSSAASSWLPAARTRPDCNTLPPMLRQPWPSISCAGDRTY